MTAAMDDARSVHLPGSESPKVFISYSRRDMVFVDRLQIALAERGITTFVDREAIEKGEDWWERIQQLIVDCDTIIFAVSPNSVKSDICHKEVDFAEGLNKRFIPVVVNDVSEHTVPTALSRLNYIVFPEIEDAEENEDFNDAVYQLVQAIQTDIEWIREHTRQGGLSRRWKLRGESEDLLLRGAEIEAAEHWAARWPGSAPEVTDTILRFIEQSRSRSVSKFNWPRPTRSMSGLAVIGVIGAVLIWWYQDQLTAEIYRQLYVKPYVLTEEAALALPARASFIECAGWCPQMVVVPAGELLMGSPNDRGDPDERPQHKVVFEQAFAASKFEISYDEWDACSDRGGCKAVAKFGQDDGSRPVVNVSWADARDYVRWLTQLTGKPYRLLSEAEWEYAARGGSKLDYSWGRDIGVGNANCDICGGSWSDGTQTSPVGSFVANGFGLYDTHGNVWEWVADPWHRTYDGAPTDGSVWTEGGNQVFRTMRGGGFNYNPGLLRTADRLYYKPTYRWYNLGFRIARTLSQ